MLSLGEGKQELHIHGPVLMCYELAGPLLLSASGWTGSSLAGPFHHDVRAGVNEHTTTDVGRGDTVFSFTNLDTAFGSNYIPYHRNRQHGDGRTSTQTTWRKTLGVLGRAQNRFVSTVSGVGKAGSLLHFLVLRD